METALIIVAGACWAAAIAYIWYVMLTLGRGIDQVQNHKGD